MSKAIKILAVAFAAAAFAAPLAQADAFRAGDVGRPTDAYRPADVGRMGHVNPWAWRSLAGKHHSLRPRDVQRMLPWASRNAVLFGSTWSQ